MRELIIAVLVVALFAGCSAAPAALPDPRPLPAATPTPALPFPTPATPTPAPVATPTPLTPGTSGIDEPYTWDAQGLPSTELAGVLAGLHTPQDVEGYLVTRYPWRDTYNAMHFISPDELLKQGYCLCSGFARFWCYALEHQGMRPDFVCFWGPDSAHAITIWKDAGGHYRMASNQMVSPSDLGTERDAAIVQSAVEFYGASWSTILVYDADGAGVRQRIVNTALPKAALAPVPGGASRNIFTIRS